MCPIQSHDDDEALDSSHRRFLQAAGFNIASLTCPSSDVRFDSTLLPGQNRTVGKYNFVFPVRKVRESVWAEGHCRDKPYAVHQALQGYRLSRVEAD
jgi:hypothetical protein